MHHNLARITKEHGIAFEEPEIEEQRRLIRELAAIAGARSITLYSCCEDSLVGGGIQDCGCSASADIGAYDTCPFACAYCYATNSHAAALERMHAHNPEDTMLWRPLAYARGSVDSTRY